MKTTIFSANKNDITKAGKILAGGGLIAFPTETVYGLGANALDDDAVNKIYAAKGRPSDNPLIVHIAKKDDIYPLVKEVPEKAKALIDKFFPGPLTIILKKSDLIGGTVSGGLDTVAVRMPSNKTAGLLIAAAGVPVAAPSANTSGLPSPTKAKYVMDDMMGKIDGIIDGGDCEYGVESTVITLAADTPTLLRPGAVTKEMLESVIGKVELAGAVLDKIGPGETAASPGMKYKHYSPKARIIIVNACKKQYESFVNTKKDAFALCFDDDCVTIPKITYGKENDDLSQAKELFDALRRLDELNAKKVYARIPNKNGVGMAVYNRLIRAAAFTVIDLKKPFTIGLTGQTGSGKAYVGSYLRKLGFTVLDTDIYAHKITQKGSPVLDVIAKEFSSGVINPNGSLNRAELGRIVFENKDKKLKLEQITHPAIIAMCKADAKGLTVLDAPLLFESGAQADCYKTICVTASEKTRLERIMKRDNISKEKALARINAQHCEEYYIKRSNYTVVNDGRDIKTQIDRILEEIL